MKQNLKNLVFGAIIIAIFFTLGAGAPNSRAFAQAVAPATPTSLSEVTVRALQEALSKQGIAVTVNGVMGDDTRAAIRTYQSQHHLPVTGEADKATLDKLGVGERRGQSPDGSPAASQAMGGPGAGTSSMMGEGMMRGGMGGGQGGTPSVGGMMPGPMMGMMGRMDSMGGGHSNEVSGVGPALLYGIPRVQEEMTPERVRAWLTQQLAWHGNPRLAVGKIEAVGDATIRAEIITVDGSLVQRLAFNRYPGLVRQVPE